MTETVVVVLPNIPVKVSKFFDVSVLFVILFPNTVHVISYFVLGSKPVNVEGELLILLSPLIIEPALFIVQLYMFSGLGMSINFTEFPVVWVMLIAIITVNIN